MQDLDLKFIREAERVTRFNISAVDFTKTTYKKEIQHLFNKHFFPNFDLSKTVNDINMNRLNALIEELRRENRELFFKLHSYELKGVGPGEATLYFLVNTARLGGGSSAGEDLIIANGRTYEVKAATISTDGYASNFKLGGTVPVYDIMSKLAELCKKHKIAISKPTEIGKEAIDKIRKLEPETYAAIEKSFVDAAAKYFSGHEIIFINNNNNNQTRGRIESIKKVKKSDISLERVTAGTVKPRIKL